MILTANYAARSQYGINSGMPGYLALKKAPDLVMIKPDYQKYRAYSELFQTILRRYDPNLELTGLDECGLDVTEYV